MIAKTIVPMLLLLWSGGASAQSLPRSAESRPNIVLVLIDDMGYGDLSVTGNPHVRTTNIDRLAQEGTRFTQFYVNAPICSPSRVAITTGTYPSRWRIHSYLDSRQKNRAREMADYLDPRAPTLARSLKQVGYATAHFGKWHMGGGRDVRDAPLITEYGFHESITSFEGLGDRYLWSDGLNQQSAKLGRGEIWWTEKHQMTRHYVDRAIDFIRRHKDEPFYINIWPNDVHDEHVPRPDLAEQYKGIARNEYEQAFFAVLEEMDRQLGRLFAEIERLGLDEKTIILLTSDNGPTDWPRYYTQGVEPPGSAGGLRGRKWSLYEGGIRMPLIVRWPDRVPAGAVDDETVVAAIDLFPSLARLAGAPLPSGFALDGEDVSRAFFGERMRRRDPIYWFYPNDLKPGRADFVTPKLAMREGTWKLLVEEDGSGAELYDLESDPAETTNVAGKFPALTGRLRNKVLAWRRTMLGGTSASPNIVLYIADDLGIADTKPYGNTVVRTPNLERLAAEALRFTHAFASSPTCSPSRSTLYTGLMPFRNGAHANHTGVKAGTRSIVHYLRLLGYRVALAGKLHVGPRESFPFEYVRNSNVPEPGYAGKGVLYTDLNMPAVDEWLGALTRDQPFALVVADHSPHVVWPERPEYDPAGVDVPATHIDTPELRDARARYYTDITKMDRNLGLLLESLGRHGFAENTLVAFTADQGPQWPFGKWSLYDAGVRVPLLVRWPGRVRPGTSTDALVSLADLVPTFVQVAGGDGGDAPEGIDGRGFLPVLLGKADAHREVVFASHTGDGAINRSPARMLRTERFKYILNLVPDTLYTTHMDRAKREGYWDSWRERALRDEHAAAVLRRYHHRPAEELYDVVADPYERRNLTADPRYAELIEDFRSRMARWRAQQGDFATGPEQLPRASETGKRVAPYVF